MSISKINSQGINSSRKRQLAKLSINRFREKRRGILLNSRPFTLFHMRWDEVEESARLRYIFIYISEDIYIYLQFLCMRVYTLKSKLLCRRGRSFQSRLYLVELSREPGASSSSSLPKRTSKTHLCVGFVVEVFLVFFSSPFCGSLRNVAEV